MWSICCRAEILGVRDQIAALKIKLDAQAKVRLWV